MVKKHSDRSRTSAQDKFSVQRFDDAENNVAMLATHVVFFVRSYLKFFTGEVLDVV